MLSNALCSLHWYGKANYTGAVHAFIGDAFCYANTLNETFLSAKTTEGDTCLIFSSDNCADSCDLCVDENGWTDMTAFRADIYAASVLCINGVLNNCANTLCNYR